MDSGGGGGDWGWVFCGGCLGGGCLGGWVIEGVCFWGWVFGWVGD